MNDGERRRTDASIASRLASLRLEEGVFGGVKRRARRALRALSVLLLFGEDLRDGSNHVRDVFARRRGAGRGRDIFLGVGRRGFLAREA